MLQKYKSYIPLAAIILFAIISGIIVQPFFIAIVSGALLAYIFHPLYSFVERWSKNSVFSALFVCITVLAGLFLIIGLLINTLVRESYVLFALLKQKLAIGLFKDCSNFFCRSVEEIVQNPEVNFHLQRTMQSVTNWIIERGSDALLQLPSMLLSLFVVFFMMFYFLRDGKKILAHINTFLGIAEKKYRFIAQRLHQIVSGVVYGYLFVAAIQGALGALGFMVFGISSPVFWGIVMSFLALIPFLGTGIVWLPASLILVLDGLFQNSNPTLFRGMGLFFYSLIVVSSFDNIIKPKLIGERAKIHPAIILLGLLGGLFLFGPIGVVLGPLFLSLTFVLIEAFILQRRWGASTNMTSSPSSSSNDPATSKSSSQNTR